MIRVLQKILFISLFIISCSNNYKKSAKHIQEMNNNSEIVTIKKNADKLDRFEIEGKKDSIIWTYNNHVFEVKRNNKILYNHGFNHLYFDSISEQIVFDELSNEILNLFVYDLQEKELVITFKLKHHNTLLDVAKLKNERIFVVLKNKNSNEELFEIETDLEILEIVEGKLSDFEIKKFDKKDK